MTDIYQQPHNDFTQRARTLQKLFNLEICNHKQTRQNAEEGHVNTQTPSMGGITNLGFVSQRVMPQLMFDFSGTIA